MNDYLEVSYDVGPSAWWNPLSDDYWAVQLGRRAKRAVVNKARRAAEETRRTIEQVQADAAKTVRDALPDPIALVLPAVQPTWGYYARDAAVVAVSTAAIAAAAYAAHRYVKGRKGGRKATR